MHKLLQTLLLISFAAPHLVAARIERLKEKELDVVRLENRFLVVKVAVNSGGRIRSLVSKADGVDQVWWRSELNAAHSGLIDDKAGFETAVYAATIEDEGPQRVSARLAGPAGEPLNITKTVTVVEDEPAIHIEYVYTNQSDKPLHTRHMVRNYYIAGGKAGAEDRYFWPGVRGPDSADFPYGDVGVTHKVLRPWYAVLDTEAQTGLAMVVDSPALASFHNWADGPPPNPTMEWIVDIKLGPRASMTVPVTFVLLRGLDGVTDATAACVLNLEPRTQANTLTLKAQAYPVVPLPADRRLAAHFRYETLDRLFLWEEDGIHFDASEPGRMASGQTRFRADAVGTHIVSVTTHSGVQTLNDFEIPVVIGHSTGGYLNGKREAERSLPLVVLTDRDVERGYVAHWGQRLRPFEPAGPIELTMGADEYESLEIGVLALKDLGMVKAQVSAPGWPADAIKVRAQQRIAIEGVKHDDGSYALVEGDTLTMPLGAHKAFWFILRSHQVKPGRYAMTFTLHPEHGPVRAVPAVVEVLDVHQAPRDEVSLYLYHTLYYTTGETHLQILKDHYLRPVEIHFPFNTWADRISVKRDDNGKLVATFGGLDSVLSLPRQMGFDQVHIVGSLWNDGWFRALDDESPDQQLNTRYEFVPLLVDRLLELGFTEIANYTLDEPPIAKATSPDTIDWLSRAKAADRRLKVHMTINHYTPVLVETLNPYMDMWTPTSHIVITLLEDIRNGTVSIDPGDRIGFYGGGWYHNIADPLRVTGWLAACHGVDYYTLFAYSATRKEWRLYDTGPNGKAYPTPGMQGMRDGFEDFRYWRQFELMLAKANALDAAKLSGDDRAALEAAQQFRERVFGMSGESLLPMHLNPAAPRAAPTVDDAKLDRWRLLTAKAELLRQMLALKAVVPGAEDGPDGTTR